MNIVSNLDEFRMKVLDLFFDNNINWDVKIVRDYEKYKESIPMKNAFLKEYGEAIIKDRYDIFIKRVQTDSELDQDKLIYDMVEELYQDYIMSCLIKEDSSKDNFSKSKYPISFEEFEEKVIKFFKEANPSKEDNKWLDRFLNEEYPSFMKVAYETACDDYDDSVNGENGVTPDKIFSEYYIKSNPVRLLEMF